VLRLALLLWLLPEAGRLACQHTLSQLAVRASSSRAGPATCAAGRLTEALRASLLGTATEKTEPPAAAAAQREAALARPQAVAGTGSRGAQAAEKPPRAP
jgi:hypothetical protein